MKRTLAALMAATLPAFPAAGLRAADVSFAVFVDGRPVDRDRSSAVKHAGTLYFEVTRAVRTFNGLLTQRGAAVRITIDGRLLECTVGERAAVLDGKDVQLPGTPFVSGGDTYVPLATIAELAGAAVKLDAQRHRALLSLGAP